MKSPAHRLLLLWRTFGTAWLAYRLRYAIRLRSGALRRRLPATDWETRSLSEFLRDLRLFVPETYYVYRKTEAPGFFFAAHDRQRCQTLLQSWDAEQSNPIAVAEALLQGRFTYFSRHQVEVGLPPDWHRNVFTGQKTPCDAHWSGIGDFGYGDIKSIWELSRFGFVYTLVRAYWRTGDERYAEVFWNLLEDWRVHNPPQYGANWKCGQEASFRVMAWCFGLYGFFDAAATTPDRLVTLAHMIAVSGARIEANLDYALSQRNNHGISEGLGLWTIGALFPEFRTAERWKTQGKAVLEEHGRQLIYDDGSFSQHSVNYHRLMLHDYIWALRLGDILRQPFSEALRERVGKAADWLHHIQDETSGQVPYYGQNDGALILPLNNCDYLDFRPVVQAAHYLCVNKRCYSDGPWNEDLLWLFGMEALSAPIDAPPRSDLDAEVGGYYTLRSENSFVFVRCGAFRDRPAQADLLHVDLWWRGQNVAIDAGTYSYNAPDPWNNPLARTIYHNTVTVDGNDQMEQVGKFVWLPWANGKVRSRGRSADRGLAYWEGEHDGYQRLSAPVSYRRGITQLDDGWWLVLDSLTGEIPHEYRLHWLLSDFPHEWDSERGRITLKTSVGAYAVQMGVWRGAMGAASLVRAESHGPRGWRAPYYNCKEPALSLALTSSAKALVFWSLFGPEHASVLTDAEQLQVKTSRWNARLTLHEGNGGLVPILKDISVFDLFNASRRFTPCASS